VNLLPLLKNVRRDGHQVREKRKLRKEKKKKIK
jgi:hypothetical protein